MCHPYTESATALSDTFPYHVTKVVSTSSGVDVVFLARLIFTKAVV